MNWDGHSERGEEQRKNVVYVNRAPTPVVDDRNEFPSLGGGGMTSAHPASMNNSAARAVRPTPVNYMDDGDFPGLGPGDSQPGVEVPAMSFSQVMGRWVI